MCIFSSRSFWHDALTSTSYNRGFYITEIGCCIMIARLLHYYIITRLNPVFIKNLMSDGREERKSQGLCNVWFMVLWDNTLKRSGK